MKEVHFTKVNPNAMIPSYQTKGSAGMDISACLSKEVVISPHGVALIPSGIAIEVPIGYEAQLRPRSGLALKSMITLPNSPATIDSDYRGEVKVILINHGEDKFVVKHGDRIAQMVIARVEQVTLVEQKTLSSTERGAGGFGHTGVTSHR